MLMGTNTVAAPCARVRAHILPPVLLCLPARRTFVLLIRQCFLLLCGIVQRVGGGCCPVAGAAIDPVVPEAGQDAAGAALRRAALQRGAAFPAEAPRQAVLRGAQHAIPDRWSLRNEGAVRKVLGRGLGSWAGSVTGAVKEPAPAPQQVCLCPYAAAAPSLASRQSTSSQLYHAHLHMRSSDSSRAVKVGAGAAVPFSVFRCPDRL